MRLQFRTSAWHVCAVAPSNRPHLFHRRAICSEAPLQIVTSTLPVCGVKRCLPSRTSFHRVHVGSPAVDFMERLSTIIFQLLAFGGVYCGWPNTNKTDGYSRHKFSPWHYCPSTPVIHFPVLPLSLSFGLISCIIPLTPLLFPSFPSLYLDPSQYTDFRWLLSKKGILPSIVPVHYRISYSSEV